MLPRGLQLNMAHLYMCLYKLRYKQSKNKCFFNEELCGWTTRLHSSLCCTWAHARACFSSRWDV